MGFFAVIFSLVIVTIQMTSILMDRKAHKWTFPLLSMTPNTTYLSELNTLFESNPINRLRFINTHEGNQLNSYNNAFNLLNKSENYTSSSTARHDKISYNGFVDIDLVLYNESKSAMAQAVCLKTAWTQKKVAGSNNDSFPRYCMFNTHLRQEIKPIMKDFNPHLILLTLCIVHSIFCIARIKRTVWSTANLPSALPSQLGSFLPRYGIAASTATRVGIEHPHVISPLMSIVVLGILLIIVFIIEGTRKSELVEYPTILVVILEMLAAIWFIIWLPFISSSSSENGNNESSIVVDPTTTAEQQQNEHKANWMNFYHLQLVAVPVAVLSIVTVGARFWTDALFHFVFLSVACNALYLERELIDNVISRKLLQLIYVLLPIFCLYMAHMQWGYFDNWRYVIGLMGSFSVIPFFIHPWIGGGSEKLKGFVSKNKYIGKLTNFASTAALLSLVVNLAMFYDDE